MSERVPWPRVKDLFRQSQQQPDAERESWLAQQCGDDDELLGEIRKDAKSLRARIDHAIDGAPLAFEIEASVGIEDGRNDREYASIGSDSGSGHGTPFNDCHAAPAIGCSRLGSVDRAWRHLP